MSNERIALWEPIQKPSSRLGRYRVLSPHAGVHVSPLQLGAMSIGDKWEKFGMGSMDKASSFKLLDAFYDAGGNFIDTANNYQDQSSEEIIGEWAEERGIRDQLVIATKVTLGFGEYISMLMHLYSSTRPVTSAATTSFARRYHIPVTTVKSMHLSVEASLKKLRTSYIDILYVHWWDWDTSVEEVMNGLHVLVQQGKVLYLGISDSPAWVVSKANQYARDHGKTPFVIYQGAWNVMLRDFERDIIPMARSEGLALAPWNVLAGGKLRTDEEEERRRQTGEKGRTLTNPNWERNETERVMSAALEKVAKEVGAKHITAVAIAYLMQKTPYVFPIVGGRKVEQLEANLESLAISLTPEHVKYLESIVPFNSGFPSTFIGDGKQYNYLLGHTAYLEKQPQEQAIVPDVD
ncbi:NADP-dependent oxidoreductase domain-containing protein [Suillus subaureus]|uniref:NADP-dependent oxidoreductase domain-containing protein n=1 Tax=Suillus subaureus TaxID=48587 RepID=A0A9P7EJR2_9AGAM|nr:NADP-dependent oxidoreductase domain-containing protein [Suillus subaureus]KAG1822881.1 NADP-dependent oxidoreductase domain-containing protein [Suillus subaureus]